MKQEEEKERIFTFVRRTGSRPEDMEEIEVPESELTHEQTAILAGEMWAQFMNLPGPAQDMFLRKLDHEMQESRKLVDSAKLVDLDGGMILTGQPGQA